MGIKKDEADPAVERELERQLKILKSGTVEITPENEFVEMLRHSIKENTPLRVKCGIDPTSRDVHLGHLVPYKKMRQFQDLGHIGVVIIGDYTASIGDPTGKNESRKSLSREQVAQNAEKYMDQVYTVLDKNKTEIRHQTEWFESFQLRDVIGWAAQTTVAKLLSHETFRERIDSGNPLSLHEMFYPMLQGVDSVFIKADVELGGTDQKFNVLMGRDYQKNQSQRPQVAMLLPIITGTCGTQKMSKSLGNIIGVFDEPFDKFGKIMSIPDNLMPEYFQYVSAFSVDEIEKTLKGLKDGSLHPNETKKLLATNIVSFFHGDDVGQEMRTKFESVFKQKQVPDDAPEVAFERGVGLIDLMVNNKMAPTNSEARRLIQSSAVGIVDGDKLTDVKQTLDDSFAGQVLKVGKRKFLKLK